MKRVIFAVVAIAVISASAQAKYSGGTSESFEKYFDIVVNLRDGK